jgi:hypothetical protein
MQDSDSDEHSPVHEVANQNIDQLQAAGDAKIAAQLARSATKSNSHQLEQLRSVYHVPINEAAKKLDIGVTLLKRLCRQHQIGRWPYRKLSSIQKLVMSVEMVCLWTPTAAARNHKHP